jgi:sec-independent protein translocase protein TatC
MTVTEDGNTEEGADRDSPQSLLTHLNELRWRVVRIAAAIVFFSLISLIFANRIRELLAAPYIAICGRGEECFQLIDVSESFSVLMRVAFFGGLILSSPVVLYQIWGFINPALTTRERKWSVPVIFATVVLFCLGVGFGYWTLPRAFQFFLGIFGEVPSQFRLGSYFSFVIRYLLAFGASFMYPVFLFGAAAAGLITSSQLATGRRWAVLVIVIAAAAITPSGDALTLTLLSAPLYVFYEITYWLVRLLLRK